MTAKEKAKELVEKYIPFCGMEMTEVQCALIAVDEIINANGLHPNDTDYDYNKAELYWQEVKQEIKNI